MSTGTEENLGIIAKIESEIANFTNMLGQKRTAMEQIVAEINQINGAIHGFNMSLNALKNPTVEAPVVPVTAPAANSPQEKNAS